MNERMIQNALRRYRGQHAVIVPNVHMAWGESDLLTVSRAGLIYDHEIKISKQDFKADTGRNGRSPLKYNKHQAFGAIDARQRQRIPNYFLYVAPSGLLAAHDVPSYAGLLFWHPSRTVADQFGWIEMIKPPPLLHRTKISAKTMGQLARALMFRYWNERERRDPRCPGVER